MARKRQTEQKELDKSTQPLELDNVDWEILDELRINGRASYGTIAKKIGLSETATRHRVHRLTKESVCQITVTIDPTRIGLTAIASIGVCVEGETKPILKQLAKIPEVAFLANTLGRYDIMLEMYCKDLEHLSSVIDNNIRTIDSIKSIETNLITDMPKFIVNPVISP